MKNSPLQKEAERIRLSFDEKAQIRANLHVFVRHAPVRKSDVVRYNQRTLPFWTFLQTNIYIRSMALTLILALFLGGGASYAAEAALPGDILYPVKIEVNERVREWVSVSEEAKAEWQTRAVERRLEEAEALAAENRLTGNVRAEIEARFEAHANRVEQRIADFDAKENLNAAADINANFETTLRAHAAILEHLNIEKGGEKSAQADIEPLINKVRIRAAGAAKTRQDAEVRVATSTNAEMKTAAEGRLKAAEHKIAEVREFIENSSANAEIRAQAEAQLNIATQTLADGKIKMEAEAYNEAFILFQQAHRIAQEAKLLLNARIRLPIEIQINLRGEEDREDENEKMESTDDTETETNAGNGSIKSKTRGTVEVEIGL